MTAAEEKAGLELSPEFRFARFIEMPLSNPPPGWEAMRIDYPEHNAVEWQVSLQGVNSSAPPLYENIASADFLVRFPSHSALTVHWSEGSHSKPSDFRPNQQALVADQPFSLESFGGRSSDGAMPYFNLQAEGGGLIIAVGWSGDWRTTFTVQSDGSVRIETGLKQSRFRLRTEEKLKIPSVLVMAYQGDWLRGQNQFRRLLKEKFTPTSHSVSELMPVAASVHGMIGFNDTTEANLMALLSDIDDLQLPIDTFWLDAGWNAGGFPAMQGNPDADPDRFPGGLTALGNAVDKAGMRFLVWFEPERAMRGSFVERQHAQWLLRPSDTPPELRYQENDGFMLLDLGIPEARAWALDSISPYIRDAQISIYRQDFNLYPSYFWHTDQTADEIGLREVRYINGLYAFLDELFRRHPGLIIDNCASGGRRLDFEIMRRSVVLWRSDSTWGDASFPRNVQAMTLGLSHWLPLHGLGAVGTDPVSLHSGMGACASFAINFRDQASVNNLREHLSRYLPIRHLFTEDFYPLTKWSDRSEDWLAFQFHDPDRGEGLVQAFRGATSEARPITLKLSGLDRAKSYQIQDWDDPTALIEKTGAELVDQGIEVGDASKEAAIVLHYRLVETTVSE